jgi:hypothetical protein
MWFDDLFGFSESTGSGYDATRARFEMTSDGYLLCASAPASSGGGKMFVGAFETPTLAELLDRARGSDPDAPASSLGGVQFAHLADPVGVESLIRDASNAGAVFQAASQFNCLEMVGPNVTPKAGVTNYFHDNTQGPKCALACPAGTVFRNYFAGPDRARGQGGEQIDCLAGVAAVVRARAPPVPWKMKNGYALPLASNGKPLPPDSNLYRGGGAKGPASPMGALSAKLASDAALRRECELALRVGVHWETSVKPPAAHRVAQVYASAVPVAYAKCVPSGEWEGFARMVLNAAYEATLAAAAAIARERKTERVAVFLTALGGGAFGNRVEWIVDAVNDALETFKDAPLDVKLVHHGSVVKSQYKNGIKEKKRRKKPE